MVLKDLNKGESIVLEMEWGDNRYNLPNKVLDILDNSLIIQPFKVQGEILDFTQKKFSDIKFRLYIRDKKNGHKIFWKNVKIEIYELGRDKYYRLTVPVFASYAQHEERRGYDRTIVDVTCQIETMESGPMRAILHDISSTGVSFYVYTELEAGNHLIRAQLTDVANNRQFDLKFDCSLVRQKMQKDGRNLLGCRLLNVDYKILEYVCMKRIEKDKDREMDSRYRE